MKSKRFLYIMMMAVFSLFFTSGFMSCKSRMSICEANRVYQTKKVKKNKSNYNTRYSFKGKPVRKDYVLRNGR